MLTSQGASPPSISGGMPFIKNYMTVSGLPSEACRQALMDDSGNPSAMRLLATSADLQGNNLSGELMSDAAATAAGVAAATTVSIDAAGTEGVVGMTVVAAGVVGATTVASAATGAAASAGFAIRAFLALKENWVFAKQRL